MNMLVRVLSNVGLSVDFVWRAVKHRRGAWYKRIDCVKDEDRDAMY